MKTCGYCGRENEDNTTHCGGCGTEFVVPDSPPPTELEEIEPDIEPESDVAPEGEAALCTSCLFPNLPECRRCKRCGAPMSPFAGFLFPDAAIAVGFVFRQAVQAPGKVLVLGGVWLYFFPGFVGSALTLLGILPGGASGPQKLASFWLAILSGGICGSMLYRVTRNFIRMRHQTSRETGA